MVAVFVVLTIILFLLVDIIIQNKTRKIPAPQNNNGIPSIQSFRIPMGFFYYPGHSWLNLQPSGSVLVGMDDFIQKLVGSVDEIKMKSIGEVVTQGQPMAEIRQKNRVLKLCSPVDGFVSKLNEDLLRNPDLLQKSPYISGWIYQIQPTHLSNNLSRLYIAEKSVAWFKSELGRLREFLKLPSLNSTPVGQTLQDGGLPVQGLLNHVDDQCWSKFEEIFLRR